MSKYIVFICKHCGSAELSELRIKTLDKDVSVLANKSLRCRRCNRASLFKSTKVFDIHNLPQDAVNQARQLNLKRDEGLYEAS